MAMMTAPERELATTCAAANWAGALDDDVPTADSVAKLGSASTISGVLFPAASVGVLIVPGNQLGMDAYFRIGFGGDAAVLQKALTRIDEWMAEKSQRPKAKQAR